MQTNNIGPNQAVEDRVKEIMRDPKTSSNDTHAWAKMRSRAFNEGNLLEAAAITIAQYKTASGTSAPVEVRALDIMRNSNALTRTPMEWKEERSKCWTANDILQAAALTFVEYLFNYRPAPTQPRNADYLPA
jgi:hypothetical protein